MATELRIRPALPAEADALTAIALAAKRHWGYPEAWIELWRRELTYTSDSFARLTIFCAEIAGDVVGVCSLSFDQPEAPGPLDPPEGAADPGGAEIEGLWITPSHMRRGIGAALMAHAVDEARRQGAHHLRIVADPYAVAFYETLGARHVGTLASRPAGRELPVLRLDLAPPGSDPAIAPRRAP
jgi:GNAT superfamily N-acetyltransferase